MNSETAVCC